MANVNCPPLPIDAEITALLEAYRAAKRKAATATKERTAVEAQGHYDKDASMPRGVSEDGAAAEERRTALAVADALLAWVDRAR